MHVTGEIELCLPRMKDEKEALAYRAEHFEAGELIIHGDGGLDEATDYRLWVEKIERDRFPDTVTPGLVPATTFFGRRKSDGRIVGTIQVRYELNECLVKYGGHIGYGVRPGERRKGYATQMLRLALDHARSMRLRRVLITCSRSNVASARTILRCGGAMENEINGDDGRTVQRYWIEL